MSCNPPAKESFLSHQEFKGVQSLLDSFLDIKCKPIYLSGSWPSTNFKKDNIWAIVPSLLLVFVGSHERILNSSNAFSMMLTEPR